MNLQDAGDIAQIVTGIGSLVVAGLAIYASKQISSQQQDLSLNSSRAYMTPDSALVTVLSPGKPPEIALSIKNWGQTPALKTRLDARVYVAASKTNGMRAAPFSIGTNKAEIAVPPQGILQLGRVGKDEIPLTPRQVEEIRSGDLTLFCDFIAHYYDVAGREHNTFVRYFLDKDRVSGGGPYAMSHGKDDMSLT